MMMRVEATMKRIEYSHCLVSPGAFGPLCPHAGTNSEDGTSVQRTGNSPGCSSHPSPFVLELSVMASANSDRTRATYWSGIGVRGSGGAAPAFDVWDPELPFELNLGYWA